VNTEGTPDAENRRKEPTRSRNVDDFRNDQADDAGHGEARKICATPLSE
jgi:hypothetical protein